jgi:NCAIR mutase (PurE)-related protein
MSEDGVPFANLDLEREERWGLPEAVLGIGKTPSQIAEIVARLRERNRGCPPGRPRRRAGG